MLPPNFIDRPARGNTSTADASLVAARQRPQTHYSLRQKRQKTSHARATSTRPYVPPSPYTQLTTRLFRTHMVREAEIAASSFARRNEPGEVGAAFAALCVEKCYEILQNKASVSEAIVARTRMILATEGMGEYARSRKYHAGKAIHLWMTVLGRKWMSRPPIMSRFPIAKARAEMDEARVLYNAAQEAVKIEAEAEDVDAQLEQEDGQMDIGRPSVSMLEDPETLDVVLKTAFP